MSRSQKILLTALTLTAVGVFAAVAWLSYSDNLPGTIDIGGILAATEESDDATITVWAIGDSLMVGASEILESAVPGIVINAEVGRPMAEGIDVLEEMLTLGSPDVLIVALGTNNGVTPDQITELMQLASGIDEVIFVNVAVPRAWESATNTAILRAASGSSNLTVVNWKTRSGSDDGVFRADGYHLTQIGSSVWVDSIVAEITN